MLEFAVVIAIFFVVVINGMTVLSVHKMSKPDSLYVLADGMESVRENETFAEGFAWADAHGYVPDVLMELEGPTEAATITVGIWKNETAKTFLACYVSPEKVFFEFVTSLTKDSNLDTSNTKDGAMMPAPPGEYRQVFNNLGLDALAQKHEEGLLHLKQHLSLDSMNRAESTDVLVQQSLIRQLDYVKALPLWQLRGVYWFLGRRNLLNNKSIAQQY